MEERKPVYLELTLTVRSCDSCDLERIEDMLLFGLERLKQVDRIRNAFAFCFCILDRPSFERDKNQPHLHCFVKAKPAYFEHGGFVSIKNLASFWRDCCDLDYIPVVDIYKITGFFVAEQEDKQ